MFSFYSFPQMSPHKASPLKVTHAVNARNILFRGTVGKGGGGPWFWFDGVQSLLNLTAVWKGCTELPHGWSLQRASSAEDERGSDASVWNQSLNSWLTCTWHLWRCGWRQGYRIMLSSLEMIWPVARDPWGAYSLATWEAELEAEMKCKSSRSGFL